MTEELLVFLWRHRLYLPESLQLPDGRNIEVIHPGELNSNAGPDFFNTRIRIGNTIWAGNAEVHTNASDWVKHKHHTDSAYDNVILHIVDTMDAEITNSKGNMIPCIKLSCNGSILAHYEYLKKSSSWVPCQKYIGKVDSFIISLWLNKLGIERLEQKSEDIAQLLLQTQNDWEEVFYRIMARSFGFHLNSQAFDALAKALPFKLLLKHSDNLLYLEALLFGQAGLLADPLPLDDYYRKLQKEYAFLATKYNLKPLAGHIWKFLRLRPVNFPTIRIAQFAALIHQCPHLFNTCKQLNQPEEFYQLFQIKASQYWDNHFLFGKFSRTHEKNLGKESVDILLLNSVIPVLFMYGNMHGMESLKNRALDLLEKIAPEKNSTMDNWKKLGITISNAYTTQSLLQLKTNYCEKHRCMECSVGNKILSMND